MIFCNIKLFILPFRMKFGEIMYGKGIKQNHHKLQVVAYISKQLQGNSYNKLDGFEVNPV